MRGRNSLMLLGIFLAVFLLGCNIPKSPYVMYCAEGYIPKPLDDGTRILCDVK